MAETTTSELDRFLILGRIGLRGQTKEEKKKKKEKEAFWW